MQYLIRLINEEKVTCAILMPYLLYDLLQYRKSHTLNLDTLKDGLTGGAATTQEELRECLEIVPNLKSVYGCSEILGTVQPLAADQGKHVGKVGLPFPNTELKVADDNGKCVPIGAPGEVCFRNFRSVSVRYVGQDIEKSKFPGGWYRIGDIGCMDEEGRLTILGRMSDVIKRATVLIFPAAVERIIIQHPKVLFVQVVSIPDERVNEEVCACVVPVEGVRLQEAELAEFADERFLAEGSSDNLGIKPKYYVIMDNFPTALSGKFLKLKIREIAIEYIKRNY